MPESSTNTAPDDATPEMREDVEQAVEEMPAGVIYTTQEFAMKAGYAVSEEFCQILVALADSGSLVDTGEGWKKPGGD